MKGSPVSKGRMASRGILGVRAIHLAQLWKATLNALNGQDRADRRIGLRPNPATRAKSIKQLAVTSEKHSDAMVGKASLRLEGFNQGEKALMFHDC